MSDLGRLLVWAGIGLVLIGGALSIFGRVPWIGRLPGDFYIERENFRFYFPLGTCILLSGLATFVFWVLRR